MHENAPFTALDHRREDRERRWHARIFVRKNVFDTAFRPRRIDWGMDCPLDVFAVEVDRRNLDLRE